jgi:hypothetical protein
MAFNKENFYQEGNSQEFFFSRTNPLANPANAEILKIKKSGCCDNSELALVAEYGYNGMGQTFDIEFDSTINARYAKVVVTDGLGHFATAVGTTSIDVLRVDVTGLDSNVTWTISVVFEVNENASVDCPCIVEYTFPYYPASGTQTVNTLTLDAPVVALFEADGTTSVVNGGNYDLGTFPDGGTTEPFSVVVKNNGQSVLTISSVSFTGDIVSFTLPQYAGVVYPGGTITLSGKVDASGIAGSYTGTITINSDAVNDPFTIDIDYTLA